MKTNLEPGDILLVKGDSWLSKSIRFFMNIYNRRKKDGDKNEEVYNHSATIISVWGKLYVAEAEAKGITISPFETSYANKMDKCKVLTPKKPYSNAEKKSISEIAVQSSFSPTRYDFFNFVFQIKRSIEGGGWEGPVGEKATKRLYCTEASATWANYVRPNTFKEPWATNPVDVNSNKYYVEKPYVEQYGR